MNLVDEDRDLFVALPDLAAIKRRSRKAGRTFAHVAVFTLISLDAGLLLFGWSQGWLS